MPDGHAYYNLFTAPSDFCGIRKAGDKLNSSVAQEDDFDTDHGQQH